jgi:hypothetical protein
MQRHGVWICGMHGWKRLDLRHAWMINIESFVFWRLYHKSGVLCLLEGLAKTCSCGVKKMYPSLDRASMEIYKKLVGFFS